MIKLEDLLMEGVFDKGILKAVFMAGGPGSGKTYVTQGLFGIPLKVGLTSAYGLKTVSSDTEFEMLLNKYNFGTDIDAMPNEVFRMLTDPSYEDYSNLRGYAKSLTKARLSKYMDGRLGVIIDGTGDKYKKVAALKKKMEAAGYDCYMVFVHTDLKIAHARNMERPRKLKPEIVEDSWHAVQKNIGFFQGLFGGSNFLIADNSDTLDEKSSQKKFSMLLKQGLDKFVNKSIQNPIGKKWIEKQKILTKNKYKK
jgi:hypothetical protein